MNFFGQLRKLAEAVPPRIRQLSAEQRWQALHNTAAQEESSWSGAILIVVIGVVAAAIGAWAWWYLRRRKARASARGGPDAAGEAIAPDDGLPVLSEAFQAEAARRDIAGMELTLLLDVIRRAAVEDPVTIFQTPADFDRGAADCLLSDEFSQMSPENQADGLDRMESLHAKMGFAEAPGTHPAVQSTHVLEPGTPLAVFRDKGCGTFHAKIAAVDDAELVVQPARPVFCRVGEALRVHFCEGTQVLEFQAAILSLRDDKIVLAHCDQLRSVSRRRFVRLPVDLPARAAPFPLRKAHANEAPRFQDARVVEIGGPGWRLESAMEVELGWRVLVEVDLGPGQVLQGMAVVQRVIGQQAQRHVWAVELLALTQEEAGQLVEAAESQCMSGPDQAGGQPSPAASAALEAPAPQLAEAGAVAG